MVRDKREKTAEELLKEERAEVRSLGPFEYYLVAIISISWALFQLALPSVLVIDSTQERAIHLAFAMALLFLLMPCFKRPKKYLGFLAVMDRIPFLDYILALVGAFTALYLALFYEGIAMRAGAPSTADMVSGTILVILLLEATRRIIGPALSVIALIFTSYAFLGPYMPDLIAFKGVSLSKYLSNITNSTEGIYCIPL